MADLKMAKEINRRSLFHSILTTTRLESAVGIDLRVEEIKRTGGVLSRMVLKQFEM